MSIAAMNWAMRQRTDGPSAQIVLYVVADTANENGVSVHADPDYIADRSRQSRATVFRRLNELESAGALTRFKKYRPDGAPIYEIRLNMDRDVDYQAPVTGGDEPSDDVHEQAKSQIETLTSETPGVAPVRQAKSHLCDSQESPSKSPEDSPQPPKGGTSERTEVREETEPSEVEGWAAFQEAFEADGEPILRVSIAKDLFRALTSAERTRVTKAAFGLVAHRSRQKKPGAKPSAQTFLREIDAWSGFEKLAPPAVEKRLVFERGSDAFAAAAIYKLLVARTPLKGDSIELKQSNLDSPMFMALARAASRFGIEGRDAWRRLDPELDKPKIASWRERIKHWSGLWPEMEKVPVLDENGQPKVNVKEWNGQQLRFPVTREGLIVPADWPPRADGTWPDLDGHEIAKAG